MENFKEIVSDKISSIYEEIFIRNPVFASILANTEVVFATKVRGRDNPTMCTNGKKIWVNPNFLFKVTKGQGKFAMLHEVIHIVLQHCFIKPSNISSRTWQEATDHVTNWLLHNEGEEVLEGIYMSKEFRGMDVFQVAEIIEKRKEDEEKESESGGEGDSDDSDSQQDSDGDSGGVDDVDDGGNQPEEGEGENGKGSDESEKREGESGEDGEGEEVEEQTSPTEDQFDDEYELPEVSSWGEHIPYEGEDVDEVRQKVVEAVSASSILPGVDKTKAPKFIQNIWDELKYPSIDWRTLLRRYKDTLGKKKYSYKRNSRRSSGSSFILPTRRSKELGEICIIVDTSGSIDENQYKSFVEESMAIFKDSCSALHLLQVDDDVRFYQKILPGQQFPLDIYGRGLTDFRPGFKFLSHKGIFPKVVIYFTDGYCFDFPPTPTMDVLWVVNSGFIDFKKYVPFGTVSFFN